MNETPQIGHALKLERLEHDGTGEVHADPVPGILPDGLRIKFTARNIQSHGDAHRAVGLQLVDQHTGGTSNQDTAGRIARTPFAAGSWASARTFHRGTWGLEGGTFPKRPGAPFDPMPDAAARRFADITVQVAEFIEERAPDAWTAAAAREARKKLQDARAEAEAVRQRVEQAEEAYAAAIKANQDARRTADAHA